MSQLIGKDIILKPGRPKVAVPIVSQLPADIIAECEAVKDLPCDMVEWRADYYFSAIEDMEQYFSDKHGYLDLVKILDDVNYIVEEKPLIFTVRSKSQGGQTELTPGQMESVYGIVCETQLVSFIDIELFNEDGSIDEECIRHQIDEAHMHGVKVIMSHHYMDETPAAGTMVDVVKKMYMLGADVCKLATMANSKADAELVLKTAAYLTNNNIGPIIMMAMGEEGTATRVAGGKYGSCITFASGKDQSAPGQVDTHTMKKWLDSYYG